MKKKVYAETNTLQGWVAYPNARKTLPAGLIPYTVHKLHYDVVLAVNYTFKRK